MQRKLISSVEMLEAFTAMAVTYLSITKKISIEMGRISFLLSNLQNH